MPIEVRELVIKATITPNEQHGSSPGASNNNAVSSQEEIISACVERVLEILKDKMER